MADYEEYTEEDASVAEKEDPTEEVAESPFPPPIYDMPKERLDAFADWVSQWLHDLKGSHQEKLAQWAEEERAYRAKYQGDLTIPFIGASGVEAPLIGMGVDPVFARLDTGIFKGDRVLILKPLRKSFVQDMPKVEVWLHFMQKHRLHLRREMAPGLLELPKHGTCILKTCYEYEDRAIKGYNDRYEVVSKKVTTSGARIFRIPLGDFLFPPRYQHLQDCPIVFERLHYTPGVLRALEKSKKLANIEGALKNVGLANSTDLDLAQQDSAQHHESTLSRNEIDGLWEGSCDYDIDGDGLDEKVIFTFNEYGNEFLQLRLNWYFHQLKPYVVIPYVITSNSLYGMGLGEMLAPFQVMLTKWERMAENNAYLANTRMFVGKDGSVHEDVLRIYCARVIKVADPSNDLLQLPIADIYPSTLAERQNIIGLAEKRTGISDYLTGRESPIVGSRATATSTLALIQEGTRRVEQVLENIRNGLAEAVMMCFYLWIQYGIDDVTDIAFGDDEVANSVHRFFNTIDRDNIDGAIAIDLAAVDAANNKVQQQQAQLALIQIGMTYLQKVMEAAQLAIQSDPRLAEFIGEIADAARAMFKDLYDKHDIPNSDMYLPDLEAFIAKTLGGASGVATGSEGSSGLSVVPGGGAESPQNPGSNNSGRSRAISAVPMPGSNRRPQQGPVAVA